MDLQANKYYKYYVRQKTQDNFRPANAHGFAVRLTVLDQIFRFHGCYRPQGFLGFLAIKNPHYFGLPSCIQKTCFIYRSSAVSTLGNSQK